MPIYTLKGCTIEVPKGGRSAKVSRPAIHLGGQLVQTEARAEFAVIPDGPSPQVQAERWAMGLPAVKPANIPEIPDTELEDGDDGE